MELSDLLSIKHLSSNPDSGLSWTPHPTKMVSWFLSNARKGERWVLMMGTRVHNSVKSQKKKCEVSYDNDHKDRDIQLKAT